MRKGLTALILAVVLLCAVCGGARGETRTFTDEGFHFVLTTFHERFPEDFEVMLKAAGLENAARKQGIILELNEEIGGVESHFDRAKALCIVEQDGKEWVLGFNVQKPWNWAMTLCSDKVLPEGRAYELTMESQYSAWRHAQFVFTFAGEDGGQERYFVGNDTRGRWWVQAYQSVDASGAGLQIEAPSARNYFQACDLPRDMGDYSNIRDYDFNVRQYLSRAPYLTGSCFADYPTTEEAAREMAQATFDALPQDGVLIGGSVNLRKKPTTSSTSLGRYFSGTIGKPMEGGAKDGWLHVSIGGVAGYVSQDYAVKVKGLAADGGWHEFVMGALPVGKLTRDCTVTVSRDAGSEAVAALAAGTLVQVMGASGDWLHVSLTPVENVMNPNDASGYLPLDAVDTGLVNMGT